jgi:hypothetical protein
MLLILVDSVAKAGPGDRPVLDEALGLLTAVEEYATAAAAAAQAQLQTPDAKNMLDGLKGKTHESQPSKGGDARRNLDKESLKLLEAASMHLEVLGKFADADPQVSDIVVKLKDIASHLEAGKNQYSEVAKKAGATKVGVAVKKEREGLKAQASKLKSVPKAAGKQVKAAIAEARSKPLLKKDDYEILEAKGSELVQAVTRKIQDNLVKNQAEQRRQVMERQAMVDSELGGSIPVRHGVVNAGPGSPGGGMPFGPGSSSAAVQGPGGVVVHLELGTAAVQTIYELVQLDSIIQSATRGRQYQLDIASSPETVEERKERRERLGTFWKEGLENDETVDAACRRAFAHVPEGPDRDRLEETLNGLGKARNLPLTVVDAEWKQFLQDADTLQKQVLRAKMAVLKMKDDPGSRSQFDKLYEESMRSNDTVDQFASKAVAALAPDESAKFELLLKKLLAGRSLMSLQRVDKLRQQCLAAELVRRVLFDKSLREKLAREVPGFWTDASVSGQTLENFWIRVLTLVVPDGKDRYFFEEAAIKGILGGWDILLKVPIQELEGVPEFQKFMASGGGDVLIMVLKEPLIIPFMLLLCFPPIAAVLLFCAPILFPLVLLNVLKLMTFTSSAVWKEGVDTGQTLEHLLVQAVRMYPDKKMAEKVEKAVLKALGPAAKCTLQELECIQTLCERSWATIFDPDHAETRENMSTAYTQSIEKLETIAAFGSRVLDLLVTDKSDRKIFDSYMRKNAMAQQLPLMMLEIERQSFLSRIGLQMEQAFPGNLFSLGYILLCFIYILASASLSLSLSHTHSRRQPGTLPQSDRSSCRGGFCLFRVRTNAGVPSLA